jgi:hypothetical protein
MYWSQELQQQQLLAGELGFAGTALEEEDDLRFLTVDR